MDHKEGWAPKNWCFPIVVLEKILECPMDGMEIQPVNSKGNQLWIFTGRTDAEAPILWPTDAKSWLIGKDTYAGKDWEQEEKRVKEDQQVGWHHRLNGHESEQTPGDREEHGSPMCCSPRGHKESGTTEKLNNSNNMSLEDTIQSTAITVVPPCLFCNHDIIDICWVLYLPTNTRLCHCFSSYCLSQEHWCNFSSPHKPLTVQVAAPSSFLKTFTGQRHCCTSELHQLQLCALSKSFNFSVQRAL